MDSIGPSSVMLRQGNFALSCSDSGPVEIDLIRYSSPKCVMDNDSFDSCSEPVPFCHNSSAVKTGKADFSPKVDLFTTATSTKSIRTPRPMDIMLGRGRWNGTHPGNRRLQILINMNLDRYSAANSRKAKTKITHEIVYIVKNCGLEPGRFLKYIEGTKTWEEVDDDVARLKVAQAFRYTVRSPPDNYVTSTMVEEHERVQNNDDSDASTAMKRSRDDSESSSSRKRARLLKAPPRPKEDEKGGMKSELISDQEILDYIASTERASSHSDFPV